MKTMWAVAALVLLVCVGCAERGPFVSDRAILTASSSAGTFVEDTSSRKPAGEPPGWLRNPDSYAARRPGRVYFLGISYPRSGEQEARESALADARKQIVRYMSAALAAKLGIRSRTDDAIHRLFMQSTSEAMVNELFVRDRYATAGLLGEEDVKALVHQAYVLVEFGAEQAQDIVEKAKAQAGKLITELEQKESSSGTDLTWQEFDRLETLKELRRALDLLSVKDFRF